MAVHEIKIPSPGESITEVEIGNWLKQDGDLVQIDESLCEIETDKATLPLVAEVSGRLKIILEQGSVANVGDVACSIDSDAAGFFRRTKVLLSLQRLFRRKHHCWQKKRILKKLDIRKAILLLLPEK